MSSPATACKSALLVPVPEAAVVMPWREHFSPAAWGIPPHVTLITPFLPADGIDGRVIEHLQTLLSAVRPFWFTLTSVRRFANLPAAADVVYLAPEPAEPFVELIAMLVANYPEAPPYGGQYDTITPHLSVLHSHDRALLDEAANAMASVVPIAARADEVWLMERSAERAEVWQTRHRFSLRATE